MTILGHHIVVAPSADELAAALDGSWQATTQKLASFGCTPSDMSPSGACPNSVSYYWQGDALCSAHPEWCERYRNTYEPEQYDGSGGPIWAMAVVAGGAAANRWISKADFGDISTLSKKYDAHAPVFGITANRNKANLKAFENALKEHMVAPGTQIYRFNYRGQGMAVGFIDPSTNKMVMLDAATGKFWTTYKLGANQYSSIVNKGFLW